MKCLICEKDYAISEIKGHKCITRFDKKFRPKRQSRCRNCKRLTKNKTYCSRPCMLRVTSKTCEGLSCNEECNSKFCSKDCYRSSLNIIYRKIKSIMVHYMGGRCIKCGYNKSLRALHFHHLRDKQYTPSTLIQKCGSSPDFDIHKLISEIDKCILLCANCHAEVHDVD